jgi:hypothetical protein
MKIERPIADMGKAAVEFPLKGALKAPAGGPGPDGRFAPSWHDSFEAAVEAARTSGRPVMLFLMLGRMDEEFC